MGLFHVLFLIPAFVDVVLVLASGTTEQVTLPACGESLLTVLTQLQGFVLIGQHKAEHHLDLEESKSDKALFLQLLEYADDAAAAEIRKDISSMEFCLKKTG